jgi:glycosyltransferase involved in cell wall biosynthesis
VKKILFVVPHRRDRAPNQRFRFEQYLSHLEKNGFQCTVSPLILTAEEDIQFYGQSNYFHKIQLGFRLAGRRIKDVARAGKFDVVFIAREAFITGSSLFEKLLRRKNNKLIFDFDDAIWLDVISTNNRFFSWLKNGTKTSKIIGLADRIFAGNEYLARYAKQFNKEVVLIPTTIDTDWYTPDYRIRENKITIGWSGSTSTIEHFQFAIPALAVLKEKFKDRVEIKVIGDAHFKNTALNIIGKAWKKETELIDLQSFDIGIMPLPDNEWTWGKCGLKGLQYMALEIPTIMSPVGVNKEIIVHGKNGFLATTTDEWVSIISTLIENPELRLRVGKAGRETVVARYSVQSLCEKYVDQFKSVIGL